MDGLGWRELTSFEQQLTQRLLDAPLPAKDQRRNQLRRKLREQLHDVCGRVVTEFHDNYGSIEFELPQDWPHAHYPVVEGMADDEDGVPIEVILFEASGQLYMLEILRAHGSPITSMPDASSFRVWVFNEPDTAVPSWPGSQATS